MNDVLLPHKNTNAKGFNNGTAADQNPEPDARAGHSADHRSRGGLCCPNGPAQVADERRLGRVGMRLHLLRAPKTASDKKFDSMLLCVMGCR